VRQITGAPSCRLPDVHHPAKTPGDAAPTQDQIRPMLQFLLADRFQLNLHHDSKVMPVYHLRQTKKSTLLKPAAPDEKLSWNLSPGPDERCEARLPGNRSEILSNWWAFPPTGR
jgi:uncharacterized protein (TIGR03435 family)